MIVKIVIAAEVDVLKLVELVRDLALSRLARFRFRQTHRLLVHVGSRRQVFVVCSNKGSRVLALTVVTRWQESRRYRMLDKSSWRPNHLRRSKQPRSRSKDASVSSFG